MWATEKSRLFVEIDDVYRLEHDPNFFSPRQEDTRIQKEKIPIAISLVVPPC